MTYYEGDTAQAADNDEQDEETQSFMKGFHEDDEAVTCEECDSAIEADPIFKEVDGEQHRFCSKVCAQEYEESMG